MCLQNFIKIFQTFKELNFSVFRILTSAKPRPIPNLFDYLIGYIMSISMCMQNFITIFLSVQETGPFTLFQNLDRWKISFLQSLWLDLVNINVNANVYQNSPLSSRDRAIFTFSEFEPRQRLGQSKMIFDNLLGYILSISMRVQNFIKIFQTV